MRTSVFLLAVFASAALLASPALAAKHQPSCYDYAWQSQDMKDCLAHPEKMKAAHKPMHKATKAKAMKDMKGMKDMKDMPNKDMPEKKS
jgi:4-hydroxyphenylpyruvate dioxygenase-like putative hemolysin